MSHWRTQQNVPSGYRRWLCSQTRRRKPRNRLRMRPSTAGKRRLSFSADVLSAECLRIRVYVMRRGYRRDERVRLWRVTVARLFGRKRSNPTRQTFASTGQCRLLPLPNSSFLCQNQASNRICRGLGLPDSHASYAEIAVLKRAEGEISVVSNRQRDNSSQGRHLRPNLETALCGNSRLKTAWFGRQVFRVHQMKRGIQPVLHG